MRACSEVCVPQHMTLADMLQVWSSPCITSTACCMQLCLDVMDEGRREFIFSINTPCEGLRWITVRA